jgi:hypothetical protein
VPVQMPAQTGVVRYAMTGVEFEPAGDAHRRQETGYEGREL